MKTTILLINLLFIILPYQLSSQSIEGRSETTVGVYGRSQNNVGVHGASVHDVGVYGYSQNDHGVLGNSLNNVGVYGSSLTYHGARFRGNGSAGYADIVLVGTNYFSGSDDGVLMSDPDLGGSDIFLTSNDAVIVELDKNGGETGNFEIWDSEGDKILVMLEGGQFEVWNGAFSNNRRLLLESDGDLFIDGNLSEGSDRNRKENIHPVDNYQVLNKIKEIPVSTWNYIGDNTPHLGPMAQDFYNAFRLGVSDKSIAGLDMQGVLLAATQAQQEIIEKQKEEIDEIKSELAELRKLLMEK